MKTRDAEGRGERRRGVLVHADEPTAEGAGIDLLVDDEPVHVAYPEIVQARTVFEWGPAPKPSKGNKARNRARQHAAAAEVNVEPHKPPFFPDTGIGRDRGGGR